MVQRKQYMEKLKKLKDKKIIKVVTGIRRCGKSTLLLLFRQYLKECGVEDDNIVAVNFEDIANEHLLDYKKLYNYVIERLVPNKVTYVFLDEVQNVHHFQKAVDSLFIKEHVDLYITGSNANMLSGELATLLSGRYIEINMLPLSFAEYFELVGGNKRDAWNAYYRNGGFPYVADIEDGDILKDYIAGIYNTVSVTAENYIAELTEAFVLYKAGRYDVKGKQYLKSLEKYYLVDISLRRLLLGDKNVDIGHILENIVYLELIRRGYTVTVGKVDDKEIDFVAEKGGDKIYYQVSASILDAGTFAREIEPLKKVNDHYPKFILSMDELPMGEDGIKQVNIVDFLLQ